LSGWSRIGCGWLSTRAFIDHTPLPAALVDVVWLERNAYEISAQAFTGHCVSQISAIKAFSK
jgi:hypothetical protein